MFEPQTRAGGRSLKFYATVEMWMKRIKRLSRTYKGEKLPIGVMSRIRVEKNRVKGKSRSAIIPIYEQFKGGGGGIDDVGSSVDYLMKWKHWRGTTKKITAPEFDFVGSRDKLIEQIEFDEAYSQLQQLVGTVWEEIEEECAVKRVNRYA